MGTKSLVHIKNGDLNSPTILTIYRQYDGYPSGMGKDIFNALNKGDTAIINGFGGDTTAPGAFNGMGCMSAWLVKQLKTDIGNVYIYPANSIGVGEEWTYTLYLDQTELRLWVQSEYIKNDDEAEDYPVTLQGYVDFKEWADHQ